MGTARNIAFEGECVDLFADIVSALGIPKSIGQIYGLLYASATPLSFSDIVERLEISKGSVSQGLQLLRSLGAINVAGLPDAKSEELRAKSPRKNSAPLALSPSPLASSSAPLALSSSPLASSSAPLALSSSPVASSSPHREYFEPELSLRKLVAGVLRERVTPFATASTDRLARLRELADQENGTGKHYLDRVKQLESWRRRLKTVLPVLGALLGPKNNQ